jgi:ketopantoate reductase
MWAWVLLWVVLVLGAGAVFGLLGLRLWKKARALLREIGTASERLTAVLATLNDVADPDKAALGPARSYDQKT